MFPHAYEVLDTVSETWRIVHGKKVPQVCHIYEINFCYGNIDAINAEERSTFPTAFPEAFTPWNTYQPCSTPSGGACPDRPVPLYTLCRHAPAGLPHGAAGAANAVGQAWPLADSARGPPAQNAFWHSHEILSPHRRTETDQPMSWA